MKLKIGGIYWTNDRSNKCEIYEVTSDDVHYMKLDPSPNAGDDLFAGIAWFTERYPVYDQFQDLKDLIEEVEYEEAKTQ